MTTAFKSSRPRESSYPNVRSWIVQRLKTPLIDKRDDKVFINPFGNTLNDIDNKDAQTAVAEAFDPAYMGAAEFEWNALPKSLSRMFEDNTIVHHQLPLIENGMSPELDGAAHQVHYVGSNEVIAENISMMFQLYVKGRENRTKNSYGTNHKEISKNDYGSLYRQLQAEHSLTMHHPSAYDTRLMGWYDLQHDFAIFTEEHEHESKLFFNLVKGNQDA